MSWLGSRGMSGGSRDIHAGGGCGYGSRGVDGALCEYLVPTLYVPNYLLNGSVQVCRKYERSTIICYCTF